MKSSRLNTQYSNSLRRNGILKYMKRIPDWGPALYEPVNLQRYAFEYSGRWRDILRMKRWQIITIFVACVFAVVFLSACTVLLLYMTYVDRNSNDNSKYIPAALGLFLLYAAYIYFRNCKRFIYYLFVDKRDIAKVLASQVDYGRRHNSWPV
jgi:hypothetical protein